MKAIITLVFIILIGATAQAQNTPEEVKVVTVENSVVDATTGKTMEIESNTNNNTEVARLYKYKNSKIKKALKFVAKTNKPKMA